MKHFIALCSMLLIFCGACFADVTAEVVSYNLDDNGNIRVWTQYKIDGVEVESRYPKIDGKYVYCTRYNTLNFAGMTKLQAKQRIAKDVLSHAKALTQNKFIEIDNRELVETFFDGLVGQSITVTETSILVDTDSDGQPDKQWTVKTDGSKVITDYITPVE